MTGKELKERGKIKVLPHKGAQEIPEIPLTDKLQDIKPVGEGKTMPEIKRELIWQIWDLLKIGYESYKSMPTNQDLIIKAILLALIAGLLAWIGGAV